MRGNMVLQYGNMVLQYGNMVQENWWNMSLKHARKRFVSPCFVVVVERDSHGDQFCTQFFFTDFFGTFVDWFAQMFTFWALVSFLSYKQFTRFITFSLLHTAFSLAHNLRHFLEQFGVSMQSETQKNTVWKNTIWKIQFEKKTVWKIHFQLRNFLEHVQWIVRRLHHAIWNSAQVSQKTATLSKKVSPRIIKVQC